ncbi:hypothetical protein [Lentzea jiangxiensis]|uniref:hypothetical protein n=1 Tax=Lentzea jiangxiensis TaxID=641025 RepID=UPI0015A238B5|nr:hypothetical protein [Lentzea jiangxiensis]
MGELFDRRAGLMFARDPHDIVAELLGAGLGYVDILPARPHGMPTRMSPNGAAGPSATTIQHVRQVHRRDGLAEWMSACLLDPEGLIRTSLCAGVLATLEDVLAAALALRCIRFQMAQ